MRMRGIHYFTIRFPGTLREAADVQHKGNQVKVKKDGPVAAEGLSLLLLNLNLSLSYLKAVYRA
jgi:hypothetical protein